MSGNDAFPQYFAYWGKVGTQENGITPYHLLAFHCLDVAACGQALLKLPQFSLEPVATALHWPASLADRLFVFFLSLHDIGKFARAFQNLAPDISSALVPPDKTKYYEHRHDTLGWLLWCDELSKQISIPNGIDLTEEFWDIWARTVTGHHGKPPKENDGSLLLHRYYTREDRQAALAFVQDLANWLLPEDLPALSGKSEQRQSMRSYSWPLAGIAVLADWIGSSREFFPYHTRPQTLQDYWREMALPQAERAVHAAGLRSQPVRYWPVPTRMFERLETPTPLQQYAASVTLAPGPQMFLLEDVTGAGKTEAALILTQRLMQAGIADGLYFALPTMATANQMYQRVGPVYRKFYAEQAEPSLILAHGARALIDGFRHSVLQPIDNDTSAQRRYGDGDTTAGAQCNAWLADNRKKALLAEVGVGTIDQALLSVLPVRHQSLRLLGLARKVLLIDEVHAYDDYTATLLMNLLTAHARQGGSAILLSATVPSELRRSLVYAWRRGRSATPDEFELTEDARYPLATQVGERVDTFACQTRPQLQRSIQVRIRHDPDDVLNTIAQQAEAGRCVCWIRNTVDDARSAYQELKKRLPSQQISLFHSRYAMGDRLDIEQRELNRFGKQSGAVQRRGRVLVATQVVEQSLDLDFDELISDLAPIDLLIQRAGRLQRHARSAEGNPASDGIEQRPAAVLQVLSPEPAENPPADWYSAFFPKASHVYPNTARLWLSARALHQAGCIVTPGRSIFLYSDHRNHAVSSDGKLIALLRKIGIEISNRKRDGAWPSSANRKYGHIGFLNDLPKNGRDRART